MRETIQPIDTTVYTTLDWQVRNLLKTAGLGIARGPVGIGKSYSINRLHDELEAEGVKVILATCAPSTEGSYQAFVKTILAERNVYHTGIVDCMEAFETLIMGNPHGYIPQPSILIVDECQGMRAPVLTMLRQLWDIGDPARLNGKGTAFAMLLCGNNTFLNRSGIVREMDLHPLRDRLTMKVRLDAPDTAELDSIAQSFCPHDANALAELRKYGRKRSNVRAIAQAYRMAGTLSGAAPVSAQNVRDAIKMMEGV
ncbi:ATP-binding protein [Roseobacter denitrificans]|nr:ATP-binding protein [Roseobacter denitrificans]SFF69192.1 AAA domain-containing protein [Roseobacter denitrificans OCh 114]